MVTCDFAPRSKEGTILLQPNNSMSWRANLLLFGAVTVLSLTIAAGFFLAGAGVILPFSLLELLALFIGTYYCLWQRQRKELITFEEHQVTVQKGFYRPLVTYHYHRLWCQLIIRRPTHPRKTPAVLLRSHGKELELGAFLNQQDKTILIERLDMLLNISSNNPDC